MSVESCFIAALGIAGHYLPDAGLENALGYGSVFGAPAEHDEVFTKVGAVKANDA